MLSAERFPSFVTVIVTTLDLTTVLLRSSIFSAWIVYFPG